MMKCSECGYDNSREGMFCAHCGAPLQEAEDNNPTRGEAGQSEEQGPTSVDEPTSDTGDRDEGLEEALDEEPKDCDPGAEENPEEDEVPEEDENLEETSYIEPADGGEEPAYNQSVYPAEDMASGTSESPSSFECLGPFELRGELGRGAMARVWRGFDTRLKRDVAIKEPLFDPRLSDEVLEEMGRRFVKEGEMAARLNHTNIVTIYEANVYDGNRPAIVMELVEGTTLSRLMEDGVLDSTTKVDVLDQLLDAVGYAHSKGVVHRDIKPDNVFVSSEGVVKLADFGIARTDDATATHATVAGAVLGTPGYMSPEQIRGASVDNRSDLFSIGVIAYEMFAGKNPFGADTGAEVTTIVYRVVNEPPESIPPESSAGLPVDVRPAIMAALAKNPDDRPQTAMEFKGMLHGGVAVPSVSENANLGQAVAASSQRSGIPRWLPYALVALVGVAIIVVIAINANSGAGGSYAANGAPTAGGASGSQVQGAAGESGSAAQTSSSDADAKAKAEAEKKKAEEEKKKAEAEAAKQPNESEQEREARTFPRHWQGNYVGNSSRASSPNGTVLRSINIDVDSISPDGSIEASCSIESEDAGEGYLHGSYTLTGSIDWDSGTIGLVGAQWIDQGELVWMCQFEGTVDNARKKIEGVASNHSRGLNNVNEWHMTAA